MSKLTGRCLCESISYEIEGQLGPIFNCHCSKCRRWHGAAFRTRASIDSKQFRWLSGQEYIKEYRSSKYVVKTFCSLCGSNLITTYDNFPDVIGIPLGGLEQDPGRRPEANIFVAFKSPWYDIKDGLPQYDHWPGSESKVRETST